MHNYGKTKMAHPDHEASLQIDGHPPRPNRTQAVAVFRSPVLLMKVAYRNGKPPELT